MRQWRLIHDNPALGAWNMAVDEAIMRAAAAGDQPPTLRLYRWAPPCLSLGYGQRVSDVERPALEARGWTLVRRMTGGRAILHTDELTYSLCLPLDHPLAAGDVVDSYREISRALLAALQRLGAQPRADRLPDGVRGVDPVCFETPSHYEITVDGRKLIGSAQARKGGGLLQHGTLPLIGDLARICDALTYPSDEARADAKTHVRSRALTLEQALGRAVSWEAAAEAVADGFVETFGIELVEASLTDEEVENAEILMETVYGAEEWTLRR